MEIFLLCIFVFGIGFAFGRSRKADARKAEPAPWQPPGEIYSWQDPNRRQWEMLQHGILPETEYSSYHLTSLPLRSTAGITHAVSASRPESEAESTVPTATLDEILSPNWKLEKSNDGLERLLGFGNAFFSSGKANWLTFLGVLLVVGSSLPLIQSASSSTLIYAILLLYSLGLFGAGFGVYRFFPWTGQVFYLVALLIVPVDFMSISGLDLSVPQDLLLSLVAFGSLTMMVRQILKTLAPRAAPLYLLILTALGLSAAFTRELERVVADLGGSRQNFEMLILLVSFAFLATGLLMQLQRLKIPPGSESLPALGNQRQILLLNALLVYAWMLVPVVNNLSPEQWDLGVWLLALAGWLSALGYRRALTQSFTLPWPPPLFRQALMLEFGAHGLGVLALGLSFLNGANPVAICVLTAGVYWLFSRVWGEGWPSRVFIGLSAALLGLGTTLGLSTSNLPADTRSLISAGLALALMALGHLPVRSGLKIWWRSSLYTLAALFSFTTWLQIGVYSAWSDQTLSAMGLTALLYVFYALWRRRNVFGYLAVVTACMTAFSTVTLLDPLLAFEDYRYYAVYFSFACLGIGYLIQRSVPLAQEMAEEQSDIPITESHVTDAMPVHKPRWRRLLSEDLIQPFKFQQRFSSALPYIFSEPLYNLALLMTSLALLVDLDDALLAGVATLFYALIFWIYPSRVWIYFVISAATSGGLDLIENALPARYHNWGFLFLSMGWFFMGTLIEEVLAARDRRKPDPDGRARWAQPFFHGALFANLLLLRYIFGDLQNAFSEEGWRKLSQEFLPILLASVFYVLKLRVYVSKLWLYPGLITATLGLYFWLGSLLPVEFGLLGLTAVAWLWLGAGHAFNHHAGVQAYIREMVRHRLPDIDTTSRFYAFHIQDFASPFYAFALLISLFVLALSTALIPQQSALFNHEFAFALTRSDPALLYLAQLVNFAALTLFLTRHYPLSVPRLDGGSERRERPQALEYLPVISASLGLLWLGSEPLTLDNLGGVLALITLAWAGLARFRSRANTLAIHNSVCALAVLALGAGLFSRSPQLLLTLPLLALSFTLLLQLKPRAAYLYGLFLALGLELGALPLFWPEGKPYSLSAVPLLLLAVTAGLGLIAQRRESLFAGPYFDMARVLSWLAPVFILSELNSWKNALLEGLPAPASGLLLWLGVYALQMLGLSLFARLDSGASTGLSTGLKAGQSAAQSQFAQLTAFVIALYAYPWSAPLVGVMALAAQGLSLRLRTLREPWPELGANFLHWAWVLPPLLFVRLFWLPLALPEDAYSLRLSSLLPLLACVAWLATSQIQPRQRTGLWWTFAVMANWGWLYAWLSSGRLPWHESWDIITAFHLVIWAPGLSMILLARLTLSKPKERDQLTMLGLVLMYIPALLAFSGGMQVWAGSEYLLLCALLGWLSLRLRIRTLLYTSLVATALLIACALLFLFIKGGLIGRWGLFIGLGFGLIALGTYVQARSERLQLAFNRLYGQLLTWS